MSCVFALYDGGVNAPPGRRCSTRARVRCVRLGRRTAARLEGLPREAGRGEPKRGGGGGGSATKIQAGFGSLGRPSTRSPTMLRWISAVPPQIVSDREKKNADTIGLTGYWSRPRWRWLP